MASKPINPFAAAKPKSAPGKKAKEQNIIIPLDYKTFDGGQYTASDVTEAVNNYSEGHTMEEQGKSMKSLARPTLLSIGRTEFAKLWIKLGSRPSSPKIHAEENAQGKFATIVFMDSVNNLDDNSFSSLANLIGPKAAEENTVQKEVFSLDSDVLEKDADVVVDGKKQKMNVKDALIKALQTAFAPSPEILQTLFSLTPIFQTKKGLIDKGLELLRDNGKVDPDKLAEFLLIGKFTTQVKPGGGDAD